MRGPAYGQDGVIPSVHIKSAGVLTSGYRAITLWLSPLRCSGQVVCVGVTPSLKAAVQEQTGQGD